MFVKPLIIIEKIIFIFIKIGLDKSSFMVYTWIMEKLKSTKLQTTISISPSVGGAVSGNAPAPSTASKPSTDGYLFAVPGSSGEGRAVQFLSSRRKAPPEFVVVSRSANSTGSRNHIVIITGGLGILNPAAWDVGPKALSLSDARRVAGFKIELKED